MHTIKAVSRKTGLSPYLLRAWEKRYSAVLPRRTETNRRLYTDRDIEKLSLLRIATSRGESIGQVASLSIRELSDLVGPERLISDDNGNRGGSNPGTVDETLNESLRRIETMDRGGLYEILLESSSRFSKPVLLEDIVIPLLHKVGELWQQGVLKVANEHLASAVIRSFLGELLIAYRVPDSRPIVMVTTPAGQIHEFGAIVTALTALSVGWRAIYLGPDLPADEIAHSVNQHNSKILALSIVYPSDDPYLSMELANIRRLLGDDVTIFAGGRAAGNYLPHLNAMEAVMVSSMAEFRNTLRYDESLDLKSC